MDAETAIETRIKPQLIEAFGRQVVNSLLTHATFAYVITDGSEEERFEAFIDSICSDDRVLGLWGGRTVARQRKGWGALVVQGEPSPGFSEQEVCSGRD